MRVLIGAAIGAALRARLRQSRYVGASWWPSRLSTRPRFDTPPAHLQRHLRLPPAPAAHCSPAAPTRSNAAAPAVNNMHAHARRRQQFGPAIRHLRGALLALAQKLAPNRRNEGKKMLPKRRRKPKMRQLPSHVSTALHCPRGGAKRKSGPLHTPDKPPPPNLTISSAHRGRESTQK